MRSSSPTRSISRWFPTAVAVLVVTGASVLAGERGHAPQPQADAVPHVVVDRAVTLERIDAALADVEILAALTHGEPPREESRSGPAHPDAARPRHVDRSLRRIDGRLEHLREHLGQLHASVEFGPNVELRVQAPERPRRVRRPISDERFGHYMRQVDDATFPSSQLPIVRDMIRDHWFTSAQAFRIVKKLGGSSGVEAGVLLYPRTVDQADFFKVYDAFTFSSDGTDLRRRIRALRDADD